jgi:hypothetical protein
MPRLARLPISTSHKTGSITAPWIAAVCWKMAEDYQTEAVKLDSGQPPDIGEPPTRF